MTDDIDSSYGELRSFVANGGGDGPESVNEALAEAINKMSWSQDRSVLKIIFLVGDAPPHMDYADGPKYPELCRIAAKKDFIINTVQCGAMAETTPIWQEIAKLSEGRYAAIAQSGNMAVVATPIDTRLAELNRKIGATLIPYGDKDAEGAVAAKEAASESATADRLSFNSRTNKAVQGAGELHDALANDRLTLQAVERKKLPAEFQELGSEELEKRVGKARADRTEVQKGIREPSAKRETFLQAESQRLAAEDKGDAFEGKVTETIHEQAAKKGIKYAR